MRHWVARPEWRHQLCLYPGSRGALEGVRQGRQICTLASIGTLEDRLRGRVGLASAPPPPGSGVFSSREPSPSTILMASVPWACELGLSAFLSFLLPLPGLGGCLGPQHPLPAQQVKKGKNGRGAVEGVGILRPEPLLWPCSSACSPPGKWLRIREGQSLGAADLASWLHHSAPISSSTFRPLFLHGSQGGLGEPRSCWPQSGLLSPGLWAAAAGRGCLGAQLPSRALRHAAAVLPHLPHLRAR